MYQVSKKWPETFLGLNEGRLSVYYAFTNVCSRLGFLNGYGLKIDESLLHFVATHDAYSYSQEGREAIIEKAKRSKVSTKFSFLFKVVSDSATNTGVYGDGFLKDELKTNSSTCLQLLDLCVTRSSYIRIVAINI